MQQASRTRLGGPRPAEGPAIVRAIEHTIELLDNGEVRVAEPVDGFAGRRGRWKVNDDWVKKAVILYFHPGHGDAAPGRLSSTTSAPEDRLRRPGRARGAMPWPVTAPTWRRA